MLEYYLKRKMKKNNIQKKGAISGKSMGLSNICSLFLIIDYFIERSSGTICFLSNQEWKNHSKTAIQLKQLDFLISLR